METQPQINVQEVIKQMYQDQDLQNLWTRLRNRMAAMVPLGVNKEGILFYSGGDY